MIGKIRYDPVEQGRLLCEHWHACEVYYLFLPEFCKLLIAELREACNKLSYKVTVMVASKAQMGDYRGPVVRMQSDSEQQGRDSMRANNSMYFPLGALFELPPGLQDVQVGELTFGSASTSSTEENLLAKMSVSVDDESLADEMMQCNAFLDDSSDTMASFGIIDMSACDKSGCLCSAGPVGSL